MTRLRALLIAAGLVITSFLALGVSPARADVCGDPSAQMAGVGDQVVSILNDPASDPAEQEAQLGRLLAANFDLPYIAKLIIGRTYRTLKPVQQAEYQQLFADFVLKTYTARMTQYSGQTFRIDGAQPAGKRDVMVSSTLQRAGGVPFQVDWRLRCRDTGHKVIDVIVEGVSMVVTQRNEFSTMIANHGFDGLLASLRDRIESAARTRPA